MGDLKRKQLHVQQATILNKECLSWDTKESKWIDTSKFSTLEALLVVTFVLENPLFLPHHFQPRKYSAAKSQILVGVIVDTTTTTVY